MEPALEHRDVERPPLGLLPVDPAARPRPAAPRLGEGLAGARAAVRVLRRLRRLRRDAVPQAGDPALRRPHDRRQRHRLLVDLRRQPAHHAVDHERRGPGSGVEQLAVRGQRRVRPRACASASTPSARWPRRCWCRLAADLGDDLVRRPARRTPRTTEAAGRASSAGSSHAAARARSPASTATPGRCASDLAAARRQPGAPGRLDRRRRRLGLRHRLRRPRPRAVRGPQRQRPRARHRGVLQHRRPGLQGHAPRSGGQVRRRRQGHRQEGPRRHRPGLRQRLRGPDRHGRQRPAGHQGAARGRRLAGPVAGHRLQHLHRPRHRHVASR